MFRCTRRCADSPWTSNCQRPVTRAPVLVGMAVVAVIARAVNASACRATCVRSQGLPRVYAHPADFK